MLWFSSASVVCVFFFSSRRRHTSWPRDWSSDVCSSDLEPMPGVATATDVFAALQAGATALKIFPAPVVGIGGMRAWSAVVPAGTQFLPVGGIDADTLGPWLEAGAQGAGIGSQLYAPGSTPHQVRQVATELVGVWQEHRP